MSVLDQLEDAAISASFKVMPEWASQIVVWRKANCARMHRPRPWSMAARYPSWPGQFDPTWIGLHCAPAPIENPPPIEKVADLFRRRLDATGREVMLPCPQGTTALFMFVAQWFTDSFMRTQSGPENLGRTDSNHEVDLCQVYGLKASETDMLRERDETGAFTHRMAMEERNGEMWPPLLCERNAQGHIVLRERFRGREAKVVRDPDGKLVEKVSAIPPLHDLDKLKVSINRSMDHLSQAEREARLLSYHATGLDNGNGTLGYAAVNTLFLRAHNHIADLLWEAKKDLDDWDQERVFQTTRCILIAILIKVVIEDYIAHIADLPLKLVTGQNTTAAWDKPNRITLEFNLLYRWHSMIPETLDMEGAQLDATDFRSNPGYAEEMGLGRMIAALSRQRVGRVGLHNVAAFMLDRPRIPTEDGGEREIPSPVEASLQLARDAGLPSFNTYRDQFKMDRHGTFDELVGEQPKADELAAELFDLYGTVDRVEFFPGLFAEGHRGDTIMGQLMRDMVAYDAFTQLLTNPLMSENLFNAETFSDLGFELIGKVSTLADVATLLMPELSPDDCRLGRRGE